MGIFNPFKKKKVIKPKEKYHILEFELPEGLPAVGSFNFNYKNFTNKGETPWHLFISIALDEKNCKENGLPKNEETSIVNKFENNLIEEINKITKHHYIGHLFNNYILDIYVYIENPEIVNDMLQNLISQDQPIRPISYNIKKDMDWLSIKQFMLK